MRRKRVAVRGRGMLAALLLAVVLAGCASDGGERPYRVRVRAPSYVNLSALPPMVEGSLLADVVAVIGSIDIVLGDVDR